MPRSSPPSQRRSGPALDTERFQALLDRSTDIVVATDRKGTVIYYNDGAQRTLAYRSDEILGEFVGRIYPDLAEAKRVMEAMRDDEHGGPGIVETFQTTFVDQQGEEIPVAISGTVLYDEQGEEDGTVGFAKDLREILHKDQLATLGEVAIGLSHEINNPLGVILNQVELLEQDIERLAGERDTSVECERIDAIRRETARVAGILERLGEMVDTDTYETVDYIGPARMIDLRERQSFGRDPRLVGAHVLVVDDDAGICGTLKEILEASGCKVSLANDGRAALDRLSEASSAGEPVDLLLSDVVMPRMDGHELYLAVHEQYPELPVLMMTAFHYDKDHIIKRSKIEGLKGVIFKKPVDPERLREVIAESLRRSKH